MDFQDISDIDLTMPPINCSSRLTGNLKSKTTQRLFYVKILFIVFSIIHLIRPASGQLFTLSEDRLRPQTLMKRSDRATPALRGLLDTLLEPVRTAQSNNGWKGFVFMDPLFKVSRGSSLEPMSDQPLQPSSMPSMPSYPLNRPQMETESAPIPYIVDPPLDMYQPMASESRYSTVKHPYHDYYDDPEDVAEVDPETDRGFISRLRARKTKSTSTTTKKPNNTPAISIGPVSGGGTAIRLGKAQITFKKGSISLGPADETKSEATKSTNEAKSTIKATKRPYRGYDEEQDDYNRPRYYPESNRDNHGSKANRNSSGQSSYSVSNYSPPEYATNYKTSASGYYQSYKPYHHLDTLIDKKVPTNQDHLTHRPLYDESAYKGSYGYSPSPVYRETSSPKKSTSSSLSTESYGKGDYEYDDIETIGSSKKIRDKRKDSSHSDEDYEEGTTPRIRTKSSERQKNRRKEVKEDRGDDHDDVPVETLDEEASEDDTSNLSRIKEPTSVVNKQKTHNNSNSSLSKSRNDERLSDDRSPSLSSGERRRVRGKGKKKKTSERQVKDSGDSDDDKLLKKEHKSDSKLSSPVFQDDGGDTRSNKRKEETRYDDDDDDGNDGNSNHNNDGKSKLISLTEESDNIVTTTMSTILRKQNLSTRRSNRRKTKDKSSGLSGHTPMIISSPSLSNDAHHTSNNSPTSDHVYFGTSGLVRPDRATNSKIESVSISPMPGAVDPNTVVTLKMTEDNPYGIGGLVSNRKPGTIYQIRLTSRIPTEPAIITKIADDSRATIKSDDASLIRLIRMMQETLEDIKRSQSTTPIPCPTREQESLLTTKSISPSLFYEPNTTIKPIVDPFLNMHHGNISVIPASMGNVSEIVERLVKSSKITPEIDERLRSGDKSERGDNIRLIEDILNSSYAANRNNANNNDNHDNKERKSYDYALDLESINNNSNSESNQPEESRTKNLRQSYIQPNTMSTLPSSQINSEPINSSTAQNSDNNGEDVPIIVVLLPPEDVDAIRGGQGN